MLLLDRVHKLERRVADLYTQLKRLNSTKISSNSIVPNLQQVTDKGNLTTNDMQVGDSSARHTILSKDFLQVRASNGLRRGTVGILAIEIASNAAGVSGLIKSDNLTVADKNYQLPDKNGTFAMLDDITGGPSYKVYTATVSQSGTNAPVAVVQENTLGGTVVFTRDDIGRYTMTLAGAFTLGKTILITPNNQPFIFIDKVNYGLNTIQYQTLAINPDASSSSNIDDTDANIIFEIRVYN